jgi:hypothetical protein
MVTSQGTCWCLIVGLYVCPHGNRMLTLRDSETVDINSRAWRGRWPGSFASGGPTLSLLRIRWLLLTSISLRSLRTVSMRWPCCRGSAAATTPC